MLTLSRLSQALDTTGGRNLQSAGTGAVDCALHYSLQPATRLNVNSVRLR